MKYHYFILLGFIILFSCGQDEFKITGIVPENMNDRTVLLYSYIDNEAVQVDSTKSQNNSFIFQGKEYLDDLSFVVLEDEGRFLTSKSIWLILEKGDIQINVENPEFLSKVGGTPLNNLYQEYKDSCNYYRLKR